MKWKKIGKIFNPFEHPALSSYAGYAQSPQALPLKDRVRVYFSIRKLDQHAKFVSHVLFVDFDEAFSEILEISREPVLEPGKLGTFDEHGIFPFSPLWDEQRILAYTCGWSRRVSVSVETSTGLAISTDNGLTFQRYGDGPILSASLDEPFLVGDSFVRKYENRYHMWYIYGTKWVQFDAAEPAERVYKIGHAVSDDGINFTRESRAIIQDVINEDECQALPTVIWHNGYYHMVFCFRHIRGFRTDKTKSYRLGYARSADMINWIRDDGALGLPVSGNDWDSEMMCYPNLFEWKGNIYLLYNGNEFGKYGFGLALLEED
jgi:sucrose-6-phosphate hydrolase SacC (GH32 family)